MRPPREDYVRVTFDLFGFTVEPAVEFRDGDHFDQLARLLRATARWAMHGVREEDSMATARNIAGGIAHCWPDRAYFVEVWQEGREGFAQVYQPFGVPRNP